VNFKYGHFRQWSNGELLEFGEQSQCLVDQYNAYNMDGKAVNGKSSLNENMADGGGIKAAYYAYQTSKNEMLEKPTLSGLNFTSDQLFFISFAQVQNNIVLT